MDFKEIDGQIVLYQAPKKNPNYLQSAAMEDALSGERLIAAWLSIAHNRHRHYYQ
ncbi:MAG: hypothetical protein R2788_21635 [Saprospiraceae bacterium]